MSILAHCRIHPLVPRQLSIQCIGLLLLCAICALQPERVLHHLDTDCWHPDHSLVGKAHYSWRWFQTHSTHSLHLVVIQLAMFDHGSQISYDRLHQACGLPYPPVARQKFTDLIVSTVWATQDCCCVAVFKGPQSRRHQCYTFGSAMANQTDKKGARQRCCVWQEKKNYF